MPIEVIADIHENIRGDFVSQREKKAIWAVGGGKGGTGKSFISSGLAICLASLKGDVMLIDADLGGPNLHTFLSVRDARPDIGDFINNRISRLEEAALPTSIPGLKLIRGSDKSLFVANLNHLKKLKLIRQIKSLKADRIIIDVGTGSSFNTLDFFILSDSGILVITPEPTAIENAYYFLKSCIARILKLYIEYFKIQDLINEAAGRLENNAGSIRDFINAVFNRDRNCAYLLTKVLRNFKPRLIINKARRERDSALGLSMAEVARKYLMVDLEFLGSVPHDEKVQESIRKFRSCLLEYPDSPASSALRLIAEKLMPPGGPRNNP